MMILKYLIFSKQFDVNFVSLQSLTLLELISIAWLVNMDIQ